MSKSITPPSDDFQIRCPRLGHQIYFSYCRRENWGTPCIKTLDCWHHYFSVKEYLQSQLSEQEWQDCFEKSPKSKLISLAELIDQAKLHK